MTRNEKFMIGKVGFEYWFKVYLRGLFVNVNVGESVSKLYVFLLFYPTVI